MEMLASVGTLFLPQSTTVRTVDGWMGGVFVFRVSVRLVTSGSNAASKVHVIVHVCLCA